MPTENPPSHHEQTDGRTIARSTWGVSALTMLSRVLGLVRDWSLIAIFGSAAWVTDAFVMAFRIPNLFRRLFGEGALSAAFIPVFVDARENQEPDAAASLASHVISLLAVVTGAIAAAGIAVCLGAGSFLALGPEITLALKLTAVMLPFLCLICCSALLSGMLQSMRIFSIPAAMAIVLNLCFLASFAYIYHQQALPPAPAPEGFHEDMIFYVAGAVLAAGLIQVLLQWLSLIFKGLRLRPRFSLDHPGVIQVLKAMGPTALGLGVVQVNVLIDSLIAYGIAVGLIGAPDGQGMGASTYLYLGNRLMQLPLGVFGVAVATTVFPYLASHASRGEDRQLLDRINSAIRLLVFVVLPASIGLGVVAAPLVRMIFQEPDLSFSDLAVYRTSTVLVCYAAGLVFFSLQHLLTRVFYARQDYMTPVRIALWMVGVNLVLNLVLIHAPDLYRHWLGARAFRISWMLETSHFPLGKGLGEAGLALATTVTALINVLLLWHALRKRLAPTVGEESWEEAIGGLHWAILRIALASVVMGVFVYFSVNSIPYEPELLARLERGLVPVILGIGGYWILCLIIPVPELDEFIRRKKPAPATKGEDRGKSPPAEGG